jgi:hypothetical protein
MKHLIFIVLLIIAGQTQAQIKTEGERHDDLSNYLDLHITFNQNVDCFAIMDDSYIDNLSPALKRDLKADSVLVMEQFWWGSVHNYGVTKIRITKEKQRFIFCTEYRCYLFIVRKPHSGRQKAKLDFQWKDVDVLMGSDGKLVVTDI